MSDRNKELAATEEALPGIGKLKHADVNIDIVNKYPKIDHPRTYKTETNQILFVSSVYTEAGKHLEMSPMDPVYNSSAKSFFRIFDSEKDLQEFINRV